MTLGEDASKSTSAGKTAAPTPAAVLTLIQREKEIEPDFRPLSLKMYRRMVGYVIAYPGFLHPLLICVIVRAIQLPILNKIFANVVNGPISAGKEVKLLLGCTLYLGLALFIQWNFYYRIRFAGLLGEGVVHDLRRDIFEKLQTLSMSFFHKTKVGRLISRVTSDTEVIRAGVQDAIFVSIVNLGQGLVAVIILWTCDKPLTLIVLATAPGYYLTYRYFRGKIISTNRANQESFSRVTATLAESVNGIRIIQGFVRQEINSRMWRNLIDDHYTYNMRSARATGTFGPVLEFLGAGVIVLIFLVGGFRVLHGRASADAIVAFYFLLGDVLTPVAMLSNNYTAAIASMAGAERIFKLLDHNPDFKDEPAAISLPDLTGRVEFKNVSFEYAPGKPVLRDLNFIAEPGKTIALVGHTGSGKSSIINLIAKFYLPTAGQLLIDGVDIRRLAADSLHHRMGIVLQQNFLFTGTVMENIRLGKPGASDDDVIEAVRKIDSLDLINSMSNGFNTRVGERGAGLSLGQRQVICFARAMLADPRIMILDEATSSMDTLTELRLQNALSKLLTGRTSFVVAHRLSTIRHADLLLVLDHGVIVERGIHDELLAAGGTYSNLYRQFIRAGEA